MAELKQAINEKRGIRVTDPPYDEKKNPFLQYMDVLEVLYGTDAQRIMRSLGSTSMDTKMIGSMKEVFDRGRAYLQATGVNDKSTAPKRNELVSSIKNAVQTAVSNTFYFTYGKEQENKLVESGKSQALLKNVISGNQGRINAAQSAIDASLKRIDEIDKQIAVSSKRGKKDAVIAIRERLKQLAKEGYADTGEVTKLQRAKAKQQEDVLGANTAAPSPTPIPGMGSGSRNADTDKFIEAVVVPMALKYGVNPGVAAAQFANEGRLDGVGARVNNFFNIGVTDEMVDEARKTNDWSKIPGYPTPEAGVERYMQFITGKLPADRYANGEDGSATGKVGRKQFEEYSKKYKDDPAGFLRAIGPTYSSSGEQYAENSMATPEYGKYLSYTAATTPTPMIQSRAPQGGFKNVFAPQVQAAASTARPIYTSTQSAIPRPPPAATPTTSSQGFASAISSSKVARPVQYMKNETQTITPPVAQAAQRVSGSGGGGGVGSWGGAPEKKTPKQKINTSSKGIVNSVLGAVKNLFGIRI